MYRQALRTAVIPRYFLDKGFEDYDPIGNEDSVNILREYAATFPAGIPKGVHSLYLSSRNCGVGKTHLACAVLHDVIGRLEEERRELPGHYRYFSEVSLKQRLSAAQSFSVQETMDEIYADVTGDGDGARQSQEAMDEIYDDVTGCWLLVLDGIGVLHDNRKDALQGPDASFEQEMLFTIIASRYDRNLPIIVTAKVPLWHPWEPEGLTFQDIAGPIAASQLREMCAGADVEIVGEDRRIKIV